MRVQFRPVDVTQDWPWVRDCVGANLCADTKGIIAIDAETSAPVAVCVMDNWTHTAVQIHFCVMRKMVLRHGFLEEIANYVFGKCGKEIMIGLVPGDNAAALKLDEHIGFTEKYRVRDGFNKGVDYVVMEMRKDECKWFEQPRRIAS